MTSTKRARFIGLAREGDAIVLFVQSDGQDTTCIELTSEQAQFVVRFLTTPPSTLTSPPPPSAPPPEQVTA
jgi:hypothetical protein